MKLRSRIFLWVALAFLLVFAASYIFENHVTRVHLEDMRQKVLKELDLTNQQKKRAIETYLSDIFLEIHAKVASLLRGINQYKLIRKGFISKNEADSKKSYLEAASLIVTNQWIDFIQNINGQDLMSQIIVTPRPLHQALCFPIKKGIYLVALKGHRHLDKWEGPFIGIDLQIQTMLQEEKPAIYSESHHHYCVLFSFDTILNFEPLKHLNQTLNLSINLLEPFLKWIELPSDLFFLQRFLNKILLAKTFLQENREQIPKGQQWFDMIKEKEQKLLKVTSVRNGKKKFSSYEHRVLRSAENFLEHYNKIGLIWGISALTHFNIFGETPVGEKAPIGMGMVDQTTFEGRILISRHTFFDTGVYDTSRASMRDKTLSRDFLTPHLDVIIPKNSGRIFLGNTLFLENADLKSYLTIGTHGGQILSALSTAIHQASILVSDQKVISVSNENGEEEFKNSPWYRLPVASMIDKGSGTVHMNGKDFFFLHIIPYEKMDLHCFIFNPVEKEFQFVNSINKISKKLIATISTQMRLCFLAGLFILLIFLDKISKYITRPITHLADTTKSVAEGKFSEIVIPKSKARKSKKDEIYTLYRSFFEMVKGLKEKEKVRSVLNKVVSKEIAEEILKANVLLGGEEKLTTVFFVDIRNFTAMTENMEPADVIFLVNACMTRIARIVDNYGGVIDKYIGDGVMVLFGAPVEKKESGLQALKCAISIVETFKEWNIERTRASNPPIDLGFGIHTGKVIAGNMGAEDRLNYTVLGSNVNLAARLCDQASHMEILITEETLNQQGVKENIEYEAMKPITLKGFTEPIPIFSVKPYFKLPK